MNVQVVEICNNWPIIVACRPLTFSSAEAALLLVSTKNRDLVLGLVTVLGADQTEERGPALGTRMGLLLPVFQTVKD